MTRITISGHLWIGAVTAAEINQRLVLLPNGKRKRILFEMAEQMYLEDFADIQGLETLNPWCALK